MKRKNKLYPDSGVELNPFIAKNYDRIMNIGSLGMYNRFINKAIRDMNIRPADQILDMGCGYGQTQQVFLL